MIYLYGLQLNNYTKANITTPNNKTNADKGVRTLQIY